MTVAASRLTHIVYHTCQVRSLHPRLGPFRESKTGRRPEGRTRRLERPQRDPRPGRETRGAPEGLPEPGAPFRRLRTGRKSIRSPRMWDYNPTKIATCAARDRCLCRWHGRHRRHRAAACRGIMALANCFETPVIAIALVGSANGMHPLSACQIARMPTCPGQSPGSPSSWALASPSSASVRNSARAGGAHAREW